MGGDLLYHAVREGLKQLKKDYDKTEDDLKALQSVGQIIGEVLRQLDEEKCMYLHLLAYIDTHSNYAQLL